MMNKITLGVVFFLLFGAYVIKVNHNYNLKEADSRAEFIKDLFGWWKQLAHNIKDVTSYAVKKQWLPKNESLNKTINITNEITKKVIK